jgi:cell cycle arrest protein BUB3
MPDCSYHTFASAGSDGIVSVWDHAAKKRLRQYQKYHNAVNAVAFNKTGTKLAVGVSYGWDNGQEGSRLPESNKVSIFVREVGDEYKVGICSCLCFSYLSR